MDNFDYLIIGGGIAGLSCAYAIATRLKEGRIGVIEAEDFHAVHATGRSAALYSETYGGYIFRQLTSASRAFYERPPVGFSDYPLLHPRGVLHVANAGQADRDALRLMLETGLAGRAPVIQLKPAQIRSLVPVMRSRYAVGAIFEPEARDLDVHEIVQGYRRGFVRFGGRIFLGTEAQSLNYTAGIWEVGTNKGVFHAEVVINAAGAWADEVAQRAGIAPIGLIPKRRTTFIPEVGRVARWPFVFDIDERWYFRGDTSGLLISPADETPRPAEDAYPDDAEIARAVFEVERATTLQVKRIRHAQAGLRTFAPDKEVVVGFDTNCDGFFWLAGHGGYGIQTAPAVSALAAALVTHTPLPDYTKQFDIDIDVMTPDRFQRATVSA